VSGPVSMLHRLTTSVGPQNLFDWFSDYFRGFHSIKLQLLKDSRTIEFGVECDAVVLVVHSYFISRQLVEWLYQIWPMKEDSLIS